MTDGADAPLFAALQKALDEEGAMYEVVAPVVGGVTDSDGNLIPAKQKIDGGPSVLYDAVALLVSEEGAGTLASDATARDFVTDAFAHAKFVAYTADAMPLLRKAGVAGDLDEGCVALDDGATPVGLHRAVPPAALLAPRVGGRPDVGPRAERGAHPDGGLDRQTAPEPVGEHRVDDPA